MVHPLLSLVLPGSIVFVGCSGAAPGPPSTPKKPVETTSFCPATPKLVVDLCGCNPVQEALTNMMSATDFNETIRTASKGCFDATLGSNFLGNKVFSGEVASCVQNTHALDDVGKARLAKLLDDAKSSATEVDVASWMACRQSVRMCQKPTCTAQDTAIAAPPSCKSFGGKWTRTDGHVLELTPTQDCDIVATFPSTDAYEHLLRVKAVGNTISGRMLRRRVADGCTMYLTLKIELLDDNRLDESVIKTEGSCPNDIDESYREHFVLTRKTEK